MTSRNTVIAVFTPSRVVFSDSLMSLIITVMFVPAKLQMNWASASGISALPAACDDRAGTACSVISHQPPVENGGIGDCRGTAPDSAAAVTPGPPSPDRAVRRQGRKSPA
jgi:hypothetical protein